MRESSTTNNLHLGYHEVIFPEKRVFSFIKFTFINNKAFISAYQCATSAAILSFVRGCQRALSANLSAFWRLVSLWHSSCLMDCGR